MNLKVMLIFHQFFKLPGLAWIPNLYLKACATGRAARRRPPPTRTQFKPRARAGPLLVRIIIPNLTRQ